MYGETAIHCVEGGSLDGLPTHPLCSTSRILLSCHGWKSTTCPGDRPAKSYPTSRHVCTTSHPEEPSGVP